MEPGKQYLGWGRSMLQIVSHKIKELCLHTMMMTRASPWLLNTVCWGNQSQSGFQLCNPKPSVASDKGILQRCANVRLIQCVLAETPCLH